MAQALHALQRANPLIRDIRGRGMLWAFELRDPAIANATVVRGLQAGLILLQSGLRGESITLAPPPVITDGPLARAFELLGNVVRHPVYA